MGWFMGSRLLKESDALCVQEPLMEGRGPPSLRNGFREMFFRPPGRRPSNKHSFGNAVRGSHGVTSPTFQFMGSRLLKESDALCVQEPGVAPAVPAGREHSFGNAIRGSRGATSPTLRFMGSENLHEMNANLDLEALMGGATLCGALNKPRSDPSEDNRAMESP